jgi:hypothetical protein
VKKRSAQTIERAVVFIELAPWSFADQLSKACANEVTRICERKRRARPRIATRSARIRDDSGRHELLAVKRVRLGYREIRRLAKFVAVGKKPIIDGSWKPPKVQRA